MKFRSAGRVLDLQGISTITDALEDLVFGAYEGDVGISSCGGQVSLEFYAFDTPGEADVWFEKEADKVDLLLKDLGVTVKR